MKKIIVAMSGGVDSSVTALLLKQQGFHIEGMFMKNWEEDDTEEFCSATQDIKDAQSVCDRLDIKLHKVNFAAEYWDNVFEHFLEEYKNGRTPNPDIWCNKEIKFKAFLDFALSLGANAIATGHYARVKNNHGEYQLLCGLDNSKDQSYFLYTLQQHQLTKALFPIGELRKSEVRKIAEENHLITHDKKDSTGICFIGERRFKDFLQKYIANQPGDIKTYEGKKIGTHDGLMYYTIGQRQGLKIGGMKSAEEKPWYVIDKDLANNILIVGQGHDHPNLYQQKLICNDLHWVAGNAPDLSKKYSAKIRYRTSAHTCIIHKINDNQLEVIFDEKQWAITPGQSIVFYDNEICLGGAIIIN